MDKIDVVAVERPESVMSACNRQGVPSHPFPELIEARTKRRVALGKEP
jgi:hypothetical protein